jgi:hypothetical protein
MTRKKKSEDDRIHLAIETLHRDVLNEQLREVRAISKPWQKMTENEQERLIHRFGDITRMIIQGCCKLMGGRGFKTFPVQLGKITVDKNIEVKVTATFDPDLIAELSSRRGTVVVLVALDMHEFGGERCKVEPDNVGDLAMPREPEESDDTQRLLPPPDHFSPPEQLNGGPE